MQAFGSSGPHRLLPSVVFGGGSESHGWISKGVLSVFVACWKQSRIPGKRRQLSHQSLELATTPGGGFRSRW